MLQKWANVKLYSYTDDVKMRFYILEAEGKEPQDLQRLVYSNLDMPQQIVEDFAIATPYKCFLTVAMLKPLSSLC